jgi:hypothetical protein
MEFAVMSHEFRVINGPLPGSGMLSGDISRIWSSNIVKKKGKKHQKNGHGSMVYMF